MSDLARYAIYAICGFGISIVSLSDWQDIGLVGKIFAVGLSLSTLGAMLLAFIEALKS